MGMGEPGMHDDHIGWAAYVSTPVAVDHLDISVLSKVLSGSLDECLIVIDCDHCPCRADHFRQDGCIISGATADLHDAVVFLDIEDIVQTRPQTGQPVVELTALVDRHEHVVIQMDWVRILGAPIIMYDFTPYAPRPFTPKALARDGGKGLQDFAAMKFVPDI